MAIQTTYSKARANLAALLKRVTDDREVVVIHRRGNEDVALVAAAELDGLLETAHLLRSPKNAERLLAALNRAQSSRQKRSKKAKPNSIDPQTAVDQLRREIGLAPKE